MPTYEYRCQFCHELTEAFQRMSDNALVTCPHCGKEGLTRIVSGGAGVLYKGEGWYVTDYSKKSSGGKEAPGVTSEAKKGATPAAKSSGDQTNEAASKPAPQKDNPSGTAATGEKSTPTHTVSPATSSPKSD